MKNLYEMCKFKKVDSKNKGIYVIIVDITVARCVRARHEEPPGRTSLLRSSHQLTLLKKRLRDKCFLVNFAEYLGTHFLQNTTGRLLLVDQLE